MLIARSAADPEPDSWCLLSLWTMPMSFIQALFFPPGPPIPLCHIVILTGVHYNHLLQQKHRYLHQRYLTRNKRKRKNQLKIKPHNTLTLQFYLCLTTTTRKWKMIPATVTTTAKNQPGTVLSKQGVSVG